MISTYLLYQSYASRPSRRRSRASAPQTEVSNAAKYYQDNIGKVTSVDDFLNDPRLFSYAMTAYGLSDMTYAKAFMKKVLTSDLSDSKSFVNKLTDPRFQTFAKAYQFSTDGNVADQAVIAQNSSDEDDTIDLYTADAGQQGHRRGRRGDVLPGEYRQYHVRRSADGELAPVRFCRDGPMASIQI